MEVVLEGPDTDHQIHDMIVFRHAGVYVGLIGLWDKVGATASTLELAWSPDSREWHWIEAGEKLIPNSRHVGDYDWGCIFASPPIFTKDEILIYYGSNRTTDFLAGGTVFCAARACVRTVLPATSTFRGVATIQVGSLPGRWLP